MTKNANRYEKLTKAFLRDNFVVKNFKKDPRFAKCEYVTSAGHMEYEGRIGALAEHETAVNIVSREPKRTYYVEGNHRQMGFLMGLMAESCRNALKDAGPPGLRDLVDSVFISNIIGWSYENAPGMLSEILGLNPSRKYYPPIGGNTPQMFVNIAAAAIAARVSKAVLMTGGEAEYAVRRSKIDNITLDWPKRKKPLRVDGDTRRCWGGHRAI